MGGKAEPESQEMTGAGMEEAGLTGEGETRNGVWKGQLGPVVDGRPRVLDPRRQ